MRTSSSSSLLRVPAPDETTSHSSLLTVLTSECTVTPLVHDARVLSFRHRVKEASRIRVGTGHEKEK